MFVTIKVATWNVRGLSENRKRIYVAQVTKLANILEHEQINIAAISETKKLGRSSESIGKNGSKIYYNEVEDGRARRGIALVLDSKWSKLLIGEPAYQRNRIILMKFNCRGNNKNLMVIAVYAPNAPKENISFYEDLQIMMDNYYAKEKEFYNLIIMGDFNAHIGKELRHNVTGEYGNARKINANSHKLIKFATDNSLTITNTYFPEQKTYTFIPKETLIDYIIVNKDFFESIERTKILQHTELVQTISTDHQVLYSIIKLRYKFDKTNDGSSTSDVRSANIKKSVEIKSDKLEVVCRTEISIPEKSSEFEKKQPYLPIESIEDLNYYNDWLQNDTNKRNLVQRLRIQGERDSDDLVSRILGQIFSQNVVKFISFTGKGMIAIARLSDTKLLGVIYDTVRLNKSPNEVTNSVIDELIKKWLKNAKATDRYRERKGN